MRFTALYISLPPARSSDAILMIGLDGVESISLRGFVKLDCSLHRLLLYIDAYAFVIAGTRHVSVWRGTRIQLASNGLDDASCFWSTRLDC